MWEGGRESWIKSLVRREIRMVRRNVQMARRKASKKEARAQEIGALQTDDASDAQRFEFYSMVY